MPYVASARDLAALIVPGMVIFTAAYLLFHPSVVPSNSPVSEKNFPVRESERYLKNDWSSAKYLSKRDKLRLNQCETKFKNLVEKPLVKSHCHFRNRTNQIAVALASFPGSGNTWVRSLVEKITGVCTGSNICDVSLRASGFVGEHVDSNAAVLIKTHDTNPHWAATTGSYEVGTFNKAVVLVRNPFDALVAEWHRKVANGLRDTTVNVESHVARAGEEWFGLNVLWNQYLGKKARSWLAVLTHWVLHAKTGRVLVVHYEDLVQDTGREMGRILSFLSLPYNSKQLARDLKSDPGHFHRKSLPSFQPFTIKQRKFIAGLVSQAIAATEGTYYKNKLKLQQYVPTDLEHS